MSEPLFDPIHVMEETSASRKMVMLVGDGVRRDITLSDFDHIESPWALDMQSALLSPDRIIQRGFSTLAVVTAHPISWEVLERWCRAQVQRARYGESQHARSRIRRFANLAVKIGRELDRLDAHPAYSGLTAKGVDPSVLPFYQYGSARMAPTPGRAQAHATGGSNPPLRHGLLLPHRVKTTGGVVTRWEQRFTA